MRRHRSEYIRPEKAQTHGPDDFQHPNGVFLMTTRRQFMMTVAPAAAALSMICSAYAADNHAAESEPAASALGYKLDATKVDAKKFPTYKAGSNCSNCQFYQGKPTDAWAMCPLLGGKQASAKGWCSGYAKKA